MGERLTVWILLGMALGIVAGLMVNWLQGPLPWLNTVLTDGLFQIVGRIFVNLLLAMVIPIVFVSLVCGTATLDDVRKVGRIGGKAIILYLATTAAAIALALSAALLIQPGRGFDLELKEEIELRDPPPLTQVLIDLFPRNVVSSMAENQVLPIIFFSILLGISATLSGAPGRKVLDLFDAANAILMKMVGIILLLAPIGVFALVARVMATQGLEAIPRLLQYVLLVAVVLIIHGFVVYSLMLKFLGGLNPIPFFRKIRTAQVFAFGTASSAATIPVTLDAVRGRMGVDNSVASFTVPLGATINMDGTAIMQGVATVFIANAYGVELGFTEYLMIMLIATLASIGTAGVPQAGLLMLSMVLVQVNVPAEGIGLIFGVDRILDMIRTAVNITGDAAVSCIVAQSEGALTADTFHAPHDEPDPIVAAGDLNAERRPAKS